MISHFASRLYLITFLAFVGVSGCSGGAGSGPSGPLRTGIFIDSPVDGLTYTVRLPSGEVVRTGITEKGGSFPYRDGELISFSIGGIVLGEAFAGGEMTPVDLVPGAFNETDEHVAAIARLLQTLDEDGLPDNGITISEAVRNGCRDKILQLSSAPPATLEVGLQGVIQDLNSHSLFSGARTLRTAAEAGAHMRLTLAERRKVTARGALATFRDEQELAAYFRAQYSSRPVSWPLYAQMPGAISAGGSTSGTAGALSSGGTSADSGSSPAFSTTNLQEAGVDESDLVKTDGRYLYVAGTDQVVISRAFPTESVEKVAVVPVNGTVDSLYLYGQTLVVLYRPDGWAGWVTGTAAPALVGYPCGIPTRAKTGVLTVNVADPYHPEKKMEFTADGFLVASRITGGKLHLVQQFQPRFPVPLTAWYDGTEAGKTRTIEANRKVVAALTMKDFVPGYTVTNGSGQTTGSGTLVAPDNFYRPDDPQGGSVVTITSFTLDDPAAPFTSVGMVADAGTVYSSTKALYLAGTRWQPTDGIVPPEEETVLHKFDLASGPVTAVGSGVVKGRIHNQFSLGEYGGVLRVAVTTGSVWGWGSGSANHIYCLKAGTDTLEVIGKLENLGLTEQIYAARFIGNRGFLVTFRQIDPLFTLDLSDPTQPKVAGELKVPGYADYLHPLDENHLLAVGKDAVVASGSFAWYQGMQLSIFDITDLSAPQLLHKQIIGVRGTGSEALQNHKAFTFLPEKNLLAFPVNLFEFASGQTYPSQYGTPTFNGLYVYRITPADGFAFLGRISAPGSWVRGTFIDQYVYAVQPDGFTAALMDSMTVPVRTLRF